MGDLGDRKSSAPFLRRPGAFPTLFRKKGGPGLWWKRVGARAPRRASADARSRGRRTLAAPALGGGNRNRMLYPPTPARGPSCPRGPSPGPGNRDVGRTAQVSGAGHWDRTHSGRGFLFFPAQTAWRICGGARELSTTCSMGAPTPFCPLASALCSNLGDRESGRKAHKVKPPLTIELLNFRSSPKR